MEYRDEQNEFKTEYDVYELTEMDNIAEILDEQMLTSMAMKCINGWHSDKQSRSHRKQRMDDALDLAMQITKEKTFPWDDCANVVLPLITIASQQFAARAYPAIVNDDAIFKAKVIGDDSGVQQAVLGPQGQPIIGQDGQPQMQLVGQNRKKNRGARVAKHLNIQFLERMENWDEDTDRLVNILPVAGNVYRKNFWMDNRPHSKLIMQDSLIVDYYTSSLKACPRITEEFKQYPYEVVEKINSGMYLDYKKVMSDGAAEEITPDTHDEGAQTNQLEAPLLFIEQHLRVDLDNDGYPEPYIVTIDCAAQQVVRMVANYESDRIEVIDNTIVKITPESYYTKYGFIPSPDGSFYDMGYGELLFNLNEACNSIVNRILDTGTLASASSGFVARGFRGKKGIHKVKPGEFLTVDVRGSSLRDSFVQIQHPQPSPSLFQTLELLIGMAEKLAQVQNVLPQEVNSQMAGITLMQLVEQGLTGFKAIYKRLYRGIKEEGQKQYRLNQLYLDDKEYATVMDDPNADRNIDYRNDFDIIPVADPTMVTNLEKMGKANNLAQWKDDPYMNPIELRQRYFDALEEDTENLLMQPPPQTDPVAELAKVEHEKNVAQIQLEREKAQAKNNEAMLKLQLEKVKMEMEAMLKAESSAREKVMGDAEIAYKNSQTIKNIEEAEAVREGSQYEQNLNQLKELSNE